MRYNDVEHTGSFSISGSFTVPFGAESTRPSSPLSGSLHFNTDDGKLYVYEGNWQVVGGQTS